MVGLMRLLALQPLKVHYFWGRIIAKFVSGPLHYRRDVAVVNIARSFPEKKYNELRQITERFYGHFGRVVAETFWFAGSYDTKRLHFSHICEIQNVDLLNRLYAERPSVMILTSHFGNWEVFGGFFSYVYPPRKVDFTEDNISVVYKKLDDRFWDRVLARNRCAPFQESFDKNCYVESQNIMRFVIEHSGEKRVYVFPTDQCPYRYAAAHTVDNFMHQPTKTMTGGAVLARKYGMAVCYMSMREREDFGYTMSFREICRDASTRSAEEIMNDFYRLLEDDVKFQPENYMWTHKRWKR